jgi:hypothetical protein
VKFVPKKNPIIVRKLGTNDVIRNEHTELKIGPAGVVIFPKAPIFEEIAKLG